MALPQLILLLVLAAAARQAGATVPRVLHDPYYDILAAYNLHAHPPSSPDPQYPTSTHHQPPHYHQEHVYEEPQRPSAFQYSVKDSYHGTEFSRHESSDVSGTKGQYQVQLPDGRLQTVIYHADEDGFHAEVLYDGESHHPQPPDLPRSGPDPTHHTTPKPIYHFTPEPIYQSTPEPIYQSTPEPIYHSTPEPIYHSTPEPIYHSTPEIIYHSTPEPSYKSTPEVIYNSTPKPVYQLTSESVYQSTPEPIYNSTPEPAHRTEPKPVFSSPDPLYHSTPKPDHHSTSESIFHSTSTPVYQTTPEPVYHSTPNSIFSSSEPSFHSLPPKPAYRTASSLRELVHRPSDGGPRLRAAQKVVHSPAATVPHRTGVASEYRTSTIYQPSGNGRGFTRLTSKPPHEVTHSTGQPTQPASEVGHSFQPSFEVGHSFQPSFEVGQSSQPAYEVVHSSQPAYDYRIAPLSTQHSSPVLFVLADGRSSESLGLTHRRSLVTSESHPTTKSTSTQPPPAPIHPSSTPLTLTSEQLQESHHVVEPQDPSPKPIITPHAHAKPKDAHLSLKVNVDEPLFRSDPPLLTPAPRITSGDPASQAKHLL